MAAGALRRLGLQPYPNDGFSRNACGLEMLLINYLRARFFLRDFGVSADTA